MAGIAAFYAIVNLPSDDIVKALHEMIGCSSRMGGSCFPFHLGDDSLHLEEICGERVLHLKSLCLRHTIAGYDA